MPEQEWTIRGERAVALSPFLLAGIVNITPDSFSDGGLYLNCGKAVKHCLDLWHEGAGILDLGAESTRPGAEFVGGDTEAERLLPVLRDLREIKSAAQNGAMPSLKIARPLPETPFPPLSADTWRASTARLALEEGADIINDISGGVFDPQMGEVLAHYRPGYILGHCPQPPRSMQKSPAYADVTEELYAYFATRLEALERAGLPAANVLLDPGIGFGKNLEHNLALLRKIERLQSLGRPLCLGVSRKSLFTDLLGPCDTEERDAATGIVSAVMAGRGVYVHRVHQVKKVARALKLAAALRG